MIPPKCFGNIAKQASGVIPSALRDNSTYQFRRVTFQIMRSAFGIGVSLMKSAQVIIIGGGLAGCEAAWQLLRRGHAVHLYEMKPQKFSPAHKMEHLAELVCSNSLKSNHLDSAPGLLKEEMRSLNSLILSVADKTAVAAGSALAVDRTEFARKVEADLLQQKQFYVEPD